MDTLPESTSYVSVTSTPKQRKKLIIDKKIYFFTFVSLVVIAFILTLMLLGGTIGITNNSKKYKVEFQSFSRRIELYKKAFSWKLFGNNGVRYKDDTTGVFTSGTIKSLKIILVDEPGDLGIIALPENRLVIASYSFTVKGKTGTMKVFFDPEKMKELSPEIQTRTVNNEIYLGLYTITHAMDNNYIVDNSVEIQKMKSSPKNYIFFTYLKL